MSLVRLGRMVAVGLASTAAALASDTDEARLALSGLDPLTLIAGGSETGAPETSFVYEGFEYRFVSETNLERFQEEPERYAIQLDGACAAMPGGFGSDSTVFTVHEERIYIFGSETCREHFLAHPADHLARHAERDSPR